MSTVEWNWRTDALGLDGRVANRRDDSERQTRTSGYAAVAAESYAVYAALRRAIAASSLADAFQYNGVDLLAQIQRLLTEEIVTRLDAAAQLEPLLLAEKPDTVIVPDADGAALARYAANKVGLPLDILPASSAPPASSHRKTSAQNLARNLAYLPRIAGLQRGKPTANHTADSRPRILFVIYYPNHLATFLPVLRHLVESGTALPWVTGADTNTFRRGDIDPRPLAALGIPYMPFEAAASWRQIAGAMPRAMQLAGRLSNLLRSPTFAATVLPQALTVHWPWLGPLLAQTLHRRLPKILLYLDLADALLDRLAPDLVVVTDETLPVLGRVSLATAREKGMPTRTLQHGFLLEDPMYYGPIIADRFSAWGEESRDFLASRGADRARIDIAGAARFSAKPVVSKNFDLHSTLGLKADERIVLFCSQPGGRDISPAVNLQTFQAILDACGQVAGVHLLVKPHPAQPDEELKRWRETAEKASGASISIVRDLPLHPAMCAADLVVTVLSTTGLEALWLDRPLLIVNFTDRPDPITSAEAGAATIALSPADLPGQLTAALDPADQVQRGAARRRFVERYLGQQDGQAVPRTVAQMLAQLDKAGAQRLE